VAGGRGSGGFDQCCGGSGAGQQFIEFVDECFKRWRTAVAGTLEVDAQFGQDVARIAAQHDDAVGQQDLRCCG
jgi:hypothetical protein